MSNRKLVIGALCVAGALTSGMAQARSDIQWSLSIGVPIGVPIYQQHQPVYAPAYPVYTRPVPIYTRPVPVYAQPQYQQPTRRDRDGDGIPNRYDRVYNPRWDRDGDGIPNRHDRAYNPRSDRGGVPTRYDHVRNDRDRDGIPDWQDRNDNRRGR